MIEKLNWDRKDYDFALALADKINEIIDAVNNHATIPTHGIWTEPASSKSEKDTRDYKWELKITAERDRYREALEAIGNIIGRPVAEYATKGAIAQEYDKIRKDAFEVVKSALKSDHVNMNAEIEYERYKPKSEVCPICEGNKIEHVNHVETRSCTYCNGTGKTKERGVE